MFQLFTRTWNPSGGVVIPPEFEYLKRTYERQLNTVIDYYANRNFAVQSNHILCRVLNLGLVPLSYNNQRFLDLVLLRAPSIAKHFQFTAPGSTGKLHDGLFYNGCKEIIVLNNDYFDVEHYVSNWKEVTAVRVLEHPISELSFLLPTGKKNTLETGLVTIEIHIGKLLAQHRGFMLEQMRKMSVGSLSVQPDTQFVYNFVLPKMLRSHADIAVFNRLVNLHIGAPMGPGLLRHPFAVIDYSGQIDKVLEKVLSRIKDTNMSYVTVLENIPGIVGENMLESMHMPDLPQTRQVWWALLLTRLKVMTFLLTASNDRSASQNRSLMNDLRIDCRQLLRENMLKAILPEGMFHDINSLLTRLSRF